MNAKLLERLILYRETHRLQVAKVVLYQKIAYQYAITRHSEISQIFLPKVLNASEIPELLLIEARAAKTYWSLFNKRLTGKISWMGRKAHGGDTANTLLDIGYHYLVQQVVNSFKEINLPTELGFFHIAQGPQAHPLAYDFMEWLRPIVVDEVFLNMIRKRKKTVERINDKITSLFVYRIKKKLRGCYFHRRLGYCVTLEYWTRLLLLEFIHSVNLGKTYKPLFPSLRHETRCRNCKNKTALAMKAATSNKQQ